jgi:hypothetical protein
VSAIGFAPQQCIEPCGFLRIVLAQFGFKFRFRRFVGKGHTHALVMLGQNRADAFRQGRRPAKHQLSWLGDDRVLEQQQVFFRSPFAATRLLTWGGDFLGELRLPRFAFRRLALAPMPAPCFS